MATTLVTLTGDVTDAIGTDFDPRRTRAYVKHNTDKIVTDSGPLHLGGGSVNVESDGTFTLPNVVASTSLATDLLATVYVDYADAATRQRATATFGPYDLSAETGTVDIRTLESVQALDPSFASVTMAQMQAILDAQIAISGIDDTDSAVSALFDPLVGPLTSAAATTKIQTVGDARFSQISKRPIHAADYGVSAANSDNTTAMENALTAAVGVACHLPAGDLTVTKAGRLSPTVIAYSSIVGDDGGATVLRFTHANGGLEIGNGTDYAYQTTLANLIIDGNNACLVPVRMRKGEEAEFRNIRIQNAVTAGADIIDTSQLITKRLQLSTLPIGLRHTGATGAVRHEKVNFYATTEPIQFGNGSVTDYIISGQWVEACPDIVTFNNTTALSVGRIIIEELRTVSALTNARWFRAKGSAAVGGRLFARKILAGCNSATSPVVDFSSINNTGAVWRCSLRDLVFADRAVGASLLIASNASTPYWDMYVDCHNIEGVAPLNWAPTNGASAGANVRGYDLEGFGTPEGAVGGPKGSTFRRYDGGASTCLYVKETNAGTTGWVAK